MNIRCFCCMGDSITSDQVSGIGTMVAHRLNAQEVLNAACGYATCSDWHEGDRNITPVTLIEPPNTNTADNVLSNQVRRVLQALTPKGSIIRWTVDGVEYAIPAEIGIGTGTLSTPDVIYIAISTNDGNQPENAPADDFAAVCELPLRRPDPHVDGIFAALGGADIADRLPERGDFPRHAAANMHPAGMDGRGTRAAQAQCHPESRAENGCALHRQLLRKRL